MHTIEVKCLRRLIPGLLLLLVCGPVNADPGALKELSGVLVVILTDDSVPTLVNARDAIQTDVELRLRIAGIRVLTAQPSNTPRLVVGAFWNDNKSAFLIHVTLVETVLLARNPSIKVEATTWQKAGGGGCSQFVDVGSVRSLIKDAVDEFLNQWLASNPK
jgi:hypothetical protein